VFDFALISRIPVIQFSTQDFEFSETSDQC
jgi:hypothetical protein